MDSKRSLRVFVLSLCLLTQVAHAQDKCSTSIFVDDRHMPPPPVYTPDQQGIFWVSPSAGPGSRVLIKGAFSTGDHQIEVAAIPSGLSDIKTLFGQGAQTVTVDSNNREGFNFVLPSSLPGNSGTVYAFHILQTNLMDRINAPELYWAMGTGGALVPNAVTLGDSLKVMGLNFPLQGYLILKGPGGVYSNIPYTSDIAERIAVAFPPNVAAGYYTLKVCADPKDDALSSNGLSLVVAAAPTPSVNRMTCPGLDSRGINDNAGVLNGFLKANVPSSGDLHLTLPAGTYLINSAVLLQPHEYIDGAGPGLTVIKASAPQDRIPDIWIQGTRYFGMTNLSFTGPLKTTLFGNFTTLGFFKNNAANLGHVLLDHVTFVCTGDGPSQPKALPSVIQAGGPDIRITNIQTDNTQVDAYNAVGLTLIPTSGGVLSNAHVILGNQGVGMYLYSCHQVIVENNLIEGTTFDPGARSCISLPTSKTTGSAKDICIVHNVLKNALSHDREGITTDMGGGSYFGLIAATNGTSTSLANTPNWGPDSYVAGSYRITIVAGKGVGEYRDIQLANGAALTTDRPWNPAPDQNSVATISLYEDHLQILHNTLNRTGCAQFYGQVFHSQIIGNKMQDALGVTLYSGIYFCSIQPLEDNVVKDNIISGTSRGDTVRNFGIRLSARDITAISGLLVTGNQLAPTARIQIADNTMRMSPVLLEFQTETLALPQTGAGGKSYVPGKGIMLYRKKQ